MLQELKSFDILINPELFSLNRLNKIKLPYPVYFAVPALAFEVSVTTVSNTKNFILEIVKLLHDQKKDSSEIAETLCIDKSLVEIILESLKKQKTDDSNEENLETHEYYIFYNLITKEFINHALDIVDFNNYLVDKDNIYIHNDKIIYQNSLGSSFKPNIHILNQEAINNTIEFKPTEKQILAAVDDKNCYNRIEFKRTEVLHSSMPVLLATAFTLTEYNDTFYSAKDIFSDGYSEYFRRLIEKYSSNEQNDLITKYKLSCQNSLELHRDEMLYTMNYKEQEIMRKLINSYGLNTILNKDVYSDLSVVINSYLTLDNNKDDLEKFQSYINSFYNKLNDGLEKMMKNLYYPYQESVIDKLKKDRFFKDDSNLKYEEIKGHYSRFFDAYNNEFSQIQFRIDPKLASFIKQRKLVDRAINLTSLITANVICSYYFDTPMKELNNVDNFALLSVMIMEFRQKVGHTNDEYKEMFEFHKIQESYDMLQELLKIFSKKNEVFKIDFVDDSNEFDEYLNSRKIDLDGIESRLLEKCNVLARDAFRKETSYFKDVVIAFEKISEVILEYCMNFYNDKKDLEDAFKLIPDDQEEALIMLQVNLLDIKVDVDKLFDDRTLNVRFAKEFLLGNKEKLAATTKILFTPLFLFVTDYECFVKLYQEIGAKYFKDSMNYIGLREHSNDAKEWDKIDVINKRYFNYCKQVTKFIGGN